MRKASGPINAERERQIIDVARDLLIERGYDGFTMDEVAARARCGKPTLYRRWPDKTRFIIDLVGGDPTPPTPDVDTGSLRGDLHMLLQSIIRSSAIRGRLVLGIALAMQDNQELAAAWRRYGLAGGKVTLQCIGERALRRGEIASLPNMELLHSLLPGTVTWCRHVEKPRKDPEAFCQELLDDVLMPMFRAAGVKAQADREPAR
jgi:AcrR family transcriptional regulator